MKKYIGIFAAMLLCALLALSAFAAETVVYVNDGGTGDGSSASAPLGNMTEAISKIANGGKVVIVDTYTCPDEYHEPTHKGNITISGGKYIFTNGSYNRWFLEGPGSTTFENITFEYGEGSTSLFLAQFFPLTFGEGVVTPADGKVYVVGGYQYNQDGVMSDAPKYDADSHITIKSGTYWAVSGFSRGSSTEEYTGTSHIVVDGGTISTVYGAAINGSYFNMKTFTPITFVMVDCRVLGRTTPGELMRTNGIIAIRDKQGHDVAIFACDTTQYPRIARRYRAALAAGPLLVSGGKIIEYDSGDSFYTHRHPRSLIGKRPNGEVVMAVIDGRAKGQAAGATIAETAYIARLLGLTDALNLDGGGSSALWTAQEGVVSHPSDNRRFDHAGERAVPNGIVARPRK